LGDIDDYTLEAKKETDRAAAHLPYPPVANANLVHLEIFIHGFK